MKRFTHDTEGIWVARPSGRSRSISYPKEGSNNCFSVEDTSFWFSQRNHIVTDAIKRFPFRKNFADIGGGNGFQMQGIAQAFPKHSCYLIEPLYQGCLNARKRGLSHVYNASAEQFDYSKNSIGGVGLFDVVEHIKDDKKILRKIIALVPPKTRIYITVPAFPSLWSDMDAASGHHHRYTIKNISSLGDSLGIQTLYTSYFFSYLTPFVFITRRLPYMLGIHKNTKKHLKSELPLHQLSPFVNSVMQPMHLWERRRVRHGKSIAIGSSLIAVFQT